MLNKLLTMLTLFLLTSLTAQGASFPLPAAGDDLVGDAFVITAQNGETLGKIGERYDIGIFEMTEANPNLNPEHLRRGQQVIIPNVYILPKFREGIVINIAELRLFYFPKNSNMVYTYPVGLGRREWRTPTASTAVLNKVKDPYWTPPQSIRNYVFEQIGKILPDSLPPGPENPLGPYAIYLTLNGYLIHGTNQPWSIGKLISSGCIRLKNEDVEELYGMVQIGQPVHLIHHPYKVGFHDNNVYMEAHVPVALEDPVNSLNVVSPDVALHSRLTNIHGVEIHWEQVDRAVREHRGIPLNIGRVINTREAHKGESYHNPNILFG